jgi:hypothetical protein
MPYCSKCGVELDPGIEHCPLCGTPVQKLEEKPSKIRRKYPDEPVDHDIPEKISGNKLRFFAWEIVTVSLLAPSLICLFINLSVEHSITWSALPLASLALVWILTTLPLLFFKRPIVIVAGEVVTIMGFLAFIDFLNNGTIKWFYQLAVPIAIVAIIVTGVVVFASVSAKRKGINIAAYMFFGLGFLNVGLDLIITSFIKKTIALSWSVFVLIPAVIVGCFFLYLHYRIKSVVDFKKVFHL